MEPPARGNGPLALAFCSVRVEDRQGNTLARMDTPADQKGGTVRQVRLAVTPSDLERLSRVVASCTDAAARTSEPVIARLDRGPEGLVIAASF